MKTLYLPPLLLLLITGVYGKLLTHPLPEGAPLNAQYEVWVREAGQDARQVSVYDAVVDPNTKSHCGFVSFDADFSAPLEVLIMRTGTAAKDVRVRPKQNAPTVSRPDGNALIQLTEAGQYSVEFDGDTQSPLYLFANPLEQSPISGPAENVIYYGPGIHLIGDDGQGRIPVEAGQTIYLAAGAVVYGRIDFGHKDEITVRGRGILCGTKFSHDPNQERVQMIYAGNSKNFTLEGITILDAPGWNCHLHQLTDATVRNVKILAWQRETDGFDPRGCQNLVIEDCFVRSGDDSVSIKLGNAHDPSSVTQSNRNIRVENCVFWPDRAHALLVGPEGAFGGPSEGHVTEDVLFRNIDILRVNERNPEFYGAMAIMCADGQTIRNITFEDIRVAPIESGNAIDVRFVDNVYTDGYGKSIENITFQDIHVEGAQPTPSRLLGLDESRMVNGIKFQRVTLDFASMTERHFESFEINEWVRAWFEADESEFIFKP